MMKRRARILNWLFGALALTFLLAGCGGGGSGGASITGATSTGVVKVSLTDAPTTDLDHVWVTVREIRFHLDPLCDDPDDGAWLRYPLPAPVTLDLAALNNGIWDTLWDGIILPVGNYQQIRVILAGTADPLTPSAVAKGLAFNNQVTDDGNAYPLTIPAAKNGIKLIGSFRVTAATPLHIVVDFDVTHDVVETGNGKYILKPRLKYFVVSEPTLPPAAIVGILQRPDGSPFANYTGYSPIIKAEAPDTISFADGSTTSVMGIKRATVVKPDGTFILYPLPAPVGQTYDLVIGGKGLQTMILQDVPAVSGTTAASPSMFTIKLQPASDYPVGAKVVNATNPDDPVFGAAVGFYQTLPRGSGDIPYLIRFRHVNPLTGSFGDIPHVNPLTGFYDSLSLAKGMVQVATFNPKAIIQSFTEVAPLEGLDTYSAYAEAHFFWPSGPMFYSPSAAFNLFLLEPRSIPTPPDCDLDDDGGSDASPDKGYYVISGGLVVDHVTKATLEAGLYDFTSIGTNGKSTFHGKGKTVRLGTSKPIKIKFKK